MIGVNPDYLPDDLGYMGVSDEFKNHSNATDKATPSPATVTAISPATGLAAGGTAVTITGTYLLNATGATLGGSALTSFVVVNDKTITAVTPAHSAGAVNLVVTDNSGTVTKTNFYTYT